MDLHGGTPYPQALALPMSLVSAYFDSDVIKQHGKAAESQQRIVSAVISRMDAILRSLGNLGKALSSR